MCIYQTESSSVGSKKSDGESILINIAEHSLAFPLKWTEHEEKHKKISFEILLPYSTQFNHSIYVYSISETFITSDSKVYRMTHQMNLTITWSEQPEQLILREHYEERWHQSNKIIKWFHFIVLNQGRSSICSFIALTKKPTVIRSSRSERISKKNLVEFRLIGMKT